MPVDLMNELLSRRTNFSVVDYLSWIRQVLGESVYQQLLQLSPNVLNFEKVFTLQEQYLYGSKRLGVRRPKLLLATAPHLLKAYALELQQESLLQIEDANRFSCRESKTVLKGPECVVFSQRLKASGCGKSKIQIGNRQSEINLVLDRKTGVKASATATTYAWFKADVASAQDYYPFGSLLPGRTYTATAGEGYRFGFNGMQRDDEVKGPGNSLDFGARMYDSRLGRWLATDNRFGKYPGISPYSAFGLNPLIYIDPTGDTLKLAGNMDIAILDVFSLIPADAQALFKIVDNYVIVDRMVLRSYLETNTELPTDAGTMLLMDVIASNQVFLYEVAEEFSRFGGDGKLYTSPASNFPDNIVYTAPKLRGQSETSYGPKDNADVQITIHPNLVLFQNLEGKNIKANRSPLIFHALKESYLIQHKRQFYPEAHPGAIEAESGFHTPSATPGKYSGYRATNSDGSVIEEGNTHED